MQHKCRETFERISEFIDGELDDSLCEKIQAHLDSCPECQDCVDSLKKTIHLCKDIPQEDLSPDFHERVMRTLRDLLGHSEVSRKSM